ncbi:MAG: c-type cytochrome [Kastovskya adunca ATA6-11-RM4]|jgi:cytochrome c6|nr:c-type cytochrome [Kastovskya adunca ATA6-11-RM4]
MTIRVGGRFLKQRLTVVLVMLIGLIAFSPTALAADTINGAQIFSAQCAACHAGGGNIIRWGKNLKKRALSRNGWDSVEAIASLVANGKNNMPAYKDRLNEQEIENVAAYVLEQAENDWH